ncbi:MAG: GIY-YIG nuclease family protein [Clostridium celatum]|nr:GIY-YIG nuclease family protein [Clostridium celatum]MDU4980864.1 GIY-YIG nuclease family protein [Clostridium celatum]
MTNEKLNSTVLTNSTKPIIQKVDTKKELSKIANVSYDTYYKGKRNIIYNMNKVIIKLNYRYHLPTICGIYVIKCVVNGKIYIGQAKNIKDKVEKYIRAINNNKVSTKHMKGVREDILNYGEDSFVIEVISFCGYENLNFLERYFIKKYNAIQYGYNSRNGYRTVSKIKSEFNLDIPEVIEEFEFNNSVSRYRIAFGSNEEYKYIIKYEDLKGVLEINSEYENEMIEFIERMDFLVYIKNYNDYYKINGNQLKNFLFDIENFKYDNAEIKRYYLESKRRSSVEIFIQCSFSQKYKELLLLESEFISDIKYIDLTYKRYKFTDNITFINSKKYKEKSEIK